MTDSLFLWLALALVLFWSVGAYNRLIRLRAQALLAFQALDVRLTHFIGLLPQLPPMPTDPSQTQPILASLPLWAGLQSASNQFDVALRIARKQVFDAEAIGALQTAHSTLQDWWARLLDEWGEHPDHFLASLKSGWAENLRQTGDAVAAFNQAVHDHNAAITQFPAMVLARVFGFRPAGCL